MRYQLGILVAAGIAAALPAATFTVTTTADSGPGSLRWAISMANANPGYDVITFAIPGGGVQTIRPLSALPPLVDPAGVLLDGLSQLGAAAGANPPSTATLLIEIDGSFAGFVDGISVYSDNNTVQGLVVNRFMYEGIRVLGGAAGPSADRNRIYCNFVGTDPTGTIDLGNGVDTSALRGGIHVGNAPFGTANHNVVEHNLASGNWSEGIWIEGPRQPGDVGFNTVAHNFVGTDVTGTAPLGNDHEGIALTEGTHDNIVRKNLASANGTDGIGVQGFNNVIHNVHVGPPIQTSRNLIEENLVGIDYALASPLPNLMRGVAIGIYGTGYWGCADRNVVRRNVIAYNIGAGVAVHEDWVDTVNGDRNEITENAMWGNGTIGIDLNDDGMTPNDPFDPDVRANQQVNYPVIGSVVYAAGVTTIRGTVDLDTSPSSARVELFLARSSRAGFDEGEWYLGSVTPSGSGTWSFTTDRLAPADRVTATTTDGMQNTSEFSLAGVVPGTPTLRISTNTVATRTAGVVGLQLDYGVARAGRMFVILAGASGVAPGTNLFPLGSVTVPLNWDGLTNAFLQVVNTPTLPGFFGTLDPGGRATAAFDTNTLAPLSPALAGAVMHFAVLGIAPFDYTSNSVALEFVNR